MNRKIFWQLIYCFFIFSLSFYLRTYKIDNPVADWHSWRQADTAAVARNFLKEGFNLLYPKSDNYFKQNPNDLDNPERYFLNEFPFYPAVVSLFYKLFGIKEVWARLVSVFFASSSAAVIFLLSKKYSSKTVAVFSSLFYAILPYNIYYGRVIMPDPTFIFFSILSLYFITLWLEKETFFLAFISFISLSLAMLVKPYAIFLGLPIAYLVLKKWGFKFLLNHQVYLVALSLLPLALWRFHINNYPEGMFGSQWLINATNIRFKGAFFRWIIFERMNRLIFATGGFVLFWLGITVKKINKENLFYFFWLLSVVIYISYFAMGNVTHDYYQLPLVPIGCIYMAEGFNWLVNFGKSWFNRWFNRFIALFLVILMLAFGWYETKGFFNVNRWEIVEAGRFVDKMLPLSAKVIAPYNRDPAFLYQTNRYGWSGLRDIEELKEYIQKGATHYVAVDYDELTDFIIKNCALIEKNSRFILASLENCRFTD